MHRLAELQKGGFCELPANTTSPSPLNR